MFFMVVSMIYKRSLQERSISAKSLVRDPPSSRFAYSGTVFVQQSLPHPAILANPDFSIIGRPGKIRDEIVPILPIHPPFLQKEIL
jgi:hypothetical protein